MQGDKSSFTQKWEQLKSEYKMIKMLGKGSFGQVALGKRRSDKKAVAIKFIPLGPDQDIIDARNILREISILS